MLLIELLNRINSVETDLPYEIEYNGIRYIKENDNYTYYEKDKKFFDTLKIDTYDLDKEIKIISKDEIIYKLKEKLEELAEEINNIEKRKEEKNYEKTSKRKI